MHPNYIVKNPKLLYIDRYGNVYPDCKTYKTPKLGHVSDINITNYIKKKLFSENEEQIFNMITIEVSSLCHAHCFYCFQEDGRRGEKYEFYQYLMEFLASFRTYWLFFSGGEILDQQDAMNFMLAYKEKFPDTWVHLKTNGNADLDKVNFIDKCCNSIMISFNGFTYSTCKTLMNVDISKTFEFCEAIKENTSTNLCVKFLNSPVSIAELPEFLEWAILIKAKAIAIQTVYQYSFDMNGKSNREESVFTGANSEYWKNIYIRVSNRIEHILKKYSGEINSNVCNLSADKETFDIIKLSNKSQQLFRTDGVYLIE